MPQDVVVRESQSDSRIRDGAALVEKLDEAGWQPSAAFWSSVPEANAWRLMLGSPNVSTKGPREAYTAIQHALGQVGTTDGELVLDDIGVVPADHPLIGLLGTVLDIGPGIGRVRLSNNVVNGHFIDDALIYRIA